MQTQKARKLLMIPGPIEFEPAVLAALAEPTPSHVAPDFIEVFGRALDNLRTVFQAVSYTHLTLPTSDLV